MPDSQQSGMQETNVTSDIIQAVIYVPWSFLLQTLSVSQVSW